MIIGCATSDTVGIVDAKVVLVTTIDKMSNQAEIGRNLANIKKAPVEYVKLNTVDYIGFINNPQEVQRLLLESLANLTFIRTSVIMVKE